MAFQYDLEEGIPEILHDNLGTQIIEFAIGYDLDETHAIIMSIMLVKVRGARDIRFGIRERDLEKEWKVTAPDYSIATVRRYIPKDRRGDILAKCLVALEKLVQATDVDKLTMETAFAHLPEPAMTKYHRICEVVEACGLPVKDSFRDETNGKNYWLFQSS